MIGFYIVYKLETMQNPIIYRLYVVSNPIIYTPMIPAKTQASHSQGIIAFGLKITLITKIS